ncbi:MAG: hypothetical protein IJC04_02525 [Oscillospiraceae bacterium]|nr:hypothetical protein [Oscillospiraceae bacterium]
MLYDYYNVEMWNMVDLYVNKIFEFLTQKSVVVLIIQAITLAFSAWDKNSGLFVILTNIGVYSIYGNVSVWISMRRRELAEKKLDEYRKKQYDRSIEVRRDEQLYSELFIPEKEQSAAERPDNKFYYMNNSGILYLQ